MNRNILLFFIVSMALVAGCKKTDSAAAWVGTYTSTGTLTDSINQVTISEVNSSTVQIQLQAHYGAFSYTFATIQQGKLQNATNVVVNETGNIAGFPALYQFSGSAVLSGNSVTVSGNATNTTNTLDVKPYYFVGSK